MLSQCIRPENQAWTGKVRSDLLGAMHCIDDNAIHVVRMLLGMLRHLHTVR